MVTAALLGISLVASAQAEPAEFVELRREFSEGQKLNYEVRSRLLTESRAMQLETFIPTTVNINYDFSLDVQELKVDGIADVLYKRDQMTIIDGETHDSPPVETVEETNWEILLTLSPINEVLSIDDRSPEPDDTQQLLATSVAASTALAQPDIVGEFRGELQRLALFVGTLDTSMDLAPKFPFPEVAVGDSWLVTVSYQPQYVEDEEETRVQRLDYEYFYDGLVESEGRQVRQIRAELDFNEDVIGLFGGTAELAGIEAINLAMKATILFEVDAETGHTLRARANSEGGFAIEATDFDRPILEDKFTGRTTLRLASGL
jgi:hypothetical protein